MHFEGCSPANEGRSNHVAICVQPRRVGHFPDTQQLLRDIEERPRTKVQHQLTCPIVHVKAMSRPTSKWFASRRICCCGAGRAERFLFRERSPGIGILATEPRHVRGERIPQSVASCKCANRESVDDQNIVTKLVNEQPARARKQIIAHARTAPVGVPPNIHHSPVAQRAGSRAAGRTRYPWRMKVASWLGVSVGTRLTAI